MLTHYFEHLKPRITNVYFLSLYTFYSKNKFVDQKKIKPKQIERKFKPEKIVEEELNITDSQKKSSMQIESKQKILVDKLLSEYLRKISMQINNIAIRSYPIQSI